jgi:hypothetical protein
MSITPWIQDEEGDYNEHYLKLPNDRILRIYSDRTNGHWYCYMDDTRAKENWDHGLDATNINAAKVEALQWALEES